MLKNALAVSPSVMKLLPGAAVCVVEAIPRRCRSVSGIALQTLVARAPQRAQASVAPPGSRLTGRMVAACILSLLAPEFLSRPCNGARFWGRKVATLLPKAHLVQLSF